MLMPCVRCSVCVHMCVCVCLSIPPGHHSGAPIKFNFLDANLTASTTALAQGSKARKPGGHTRTHAHKQTLTWHYTQATDWPSHTDRTLVYRVACGFTRAHYVCSVPLQAVCVFVNDHLPDEVLKELKSMVRGTHTPTHPPTHPPHPHPPCTSPPPP
jgi:hypothetical protein